MQEAFPRPRPRPTIQAPISWILRPHRRGFRQPNAIRSPNDMLWMVLPIQCSACGRMSDGASFVDGVTYPICTDGNYSCLEFHMKQHGRTAAQIIGLQVRAIFKKKKNFPEDVGAIIGAFLHSPVPLRTISRSHVYRVCNAARQQMELKQ